MKHLLLPVLIVPLLLSGACAPIEDEAAYTADEVIMVASSFSPDCRVKIKSDNRAAP